VEALSLRAHLLVAVLIIGIVAVPILPQAHAASGTYFDNIVVIAMENRAYTEVIGNSNAPFINSMIPYSATLQHYNSYGAAGRTVGGCSAGCYVALTSGSDQGVSDGYGCCLSVTTLVDGIAGIGGTWQTYCESGCPRGNDHFPFTAYASISNSPNILAGSSVSTSDFINVANSANPPGFLWYTPTDAHNMHDNSVSTGDSYLQSFLVGGGTISSPAPGSLFASSLFTSSKRVLFLLWWDECGNSAYGCDSNNSTPNVWYGPKTSIIPGYSSTSTAYDEYSILHLIENNWGIPTLANDAAATPMTEIFGSAGPQPLATSFIVSPSAPLVNAQVTVTATTTGGKSPYTVSWNFGDGSTGTGVSLTHTFSSARSYTIAETATDASSPSQTATNSKTVTVATTPPPPPATTYTLSFQGFDFDGANEETITMNGALVAIVPTVLTSANGATWISFSYDITSFLVVGANTLSFTHANFDCPYLDQVRNLVVSNQTDTIYSNATAENVNTASNCTNTLTYHFGSSTAPGGSTGGNKGSGGGSNGSCAICGIFPTVSPTVWLLAIGGLLGLASSFAILTIRARASLQKTKRRLYH